MATEHDCKDCDYFEIDNLMYDKCPKCGSQRISNHFDENPVLSDAPGIFDRETDDDDE